MINQNQIFNSKKEAMQFVINSVLSNTTITASERDAAEYAGVNVEMVVNYVKTICDTGSDP